MSKKQNCPRLGINVAAIRTPALSFLHCLFTSDCLPNKGTNTFSALEELNMNFAIGSRHLCTFIEPQQKGFVVSVLQLVMLIYIYIFDPHIFDLLWHAFTKATDGQHGRTNYYHNHFMKLIWVLEY